MIHTHQPTVFNQIFSLVRNHTDPILGQLKQKKRVFDIESLFKVHLFSQMSGKKSLRDVETGLQSNEGKLYHMNMDSIARSTISYWNNNVSPELFEKLFYSIYNQYKGTFTKKVDLGIETIALDSSLISLALSTYNRAKYRTSKGGVRVHIGIDIGECLPRFCVITDGKKADNLIAQQIVNEKKIKKGEMIVFDRYYVDFKLRDAINKQESFFVTRTKTNTDYVAVDLYPLKGEGISYDAKVELCGINADKKYNGPLRVVRFIDPTDKKEYEYITNNFVLSAEQIANIYKHRRNIEVFFRRIKQNLKIKAFLGTSENAVKNQIWVALIYYMLLKYLVESIKLGVNQGLKLARLLANKCLDRIGISELFAICKSKTSRCLSIVGPPPDSLFS